MVTADRAQLPANKRLFLGLLTAGLFAAGLLAAVIWYLLFSPQQAFLYRLLFLFLLALFATGLFLAACGLIGIVGTLLLSRTFPLLQGPMRAAIALFFPVALMLGRLLHIDADRIKRSFVEVNNQLVRARRFSLAPGELLLLAPHCLQRSECPHKITTNVGNCRRCGRCSVDGLLRLRDKYGFHVGMATGGTLARKYVREYRPRAIVAVACERDLESGIRETSPIPVLGVINERPCGPCLNTRVDLSRVEEAVLYFLRDRV